MLTTLIALLSAYLLTAVAVAIHACNRLGAMRRQDWIEDELDRALLVAVALLASALWGVLLPVYARGWFASPGPKRTAARVSERWRQLRSRVIPRRGVPPVPR